MGTEHHDDPAAAGRPDERVTERSLLLPEERVAGSDDPETQAAAVLDDSDERTEDPEGTRRASSQTPGPQE